MIEEPNIQSNALKSRLGNLKIATLIQTEPQKSRVKGESRIEDMIRISKIGQPLDAMVIRDFKPLES